MSSPNRKSLARRALLAVALMIGFYVLAIAISLALIAGPLLVGYFPLKLAALCWFAGVAVVWSIVPRFDRFQAPGPKLDSAEQPRLFREIEALAHATHQPMPREVYLVPDVNAFVTRRGGVMGLFSRPVLGIGLPLAASLSSAELRSVLAHEFGHFYGGDTHLGPWIHKTHGAVGRTLNTLDDADSSFMQVVHWPFQQYGAMFLRITQAISRQQELTADRLAARIAGGRTFASALCKLRRGALAYSGYWSTEYRVAVNRGFRLPLAEGFASFLSAASARGLDETVARMLEEEVPDAFDSHPPTRERIAALQAEIGTVPTDDEPALAWFTNVAELEQRVLRQMVRGTDVAALRPLAWSDTMAQVWIPGWRESCARHADKLRDRTVSELPQCARQFADIGKGLADRALDDDQARMRAAQLFGAAFGLALADAGWRLHSDPGADFRATRGERALEPFAIVRDLAAGTLDPDAWQARVADLGIADLALSARTGDAVPSRR